MFRFLFVMMTATLIGVGSGYFLWGSRVARLTEALSSLTLEIDTMRARLASPAASPGASEDAAKSADQLRVINEAVASFRQELAEQKTMVEKVVATALPPESAAISNELRDARTELARCIADKQDLQLRSGAAAPTPGGAPPVAAPQIPVQRAPIPATPPPPAPVYPSSPFPR